MTLTFPRLLFALLVAAVLLPSPAGAADFTWNGGAPAASNAWSTGANWEGGTAPTDSSAIGTLSLSALTRAACQADPPTAEACWVSDNDVSGLSVDHLQLSSDFMGSSYHVTGNGITLGSGGLSASPTSSATAGGAFLLLPITLGASQTWNLSGGGNVIAQDLTGVSADLSVSLADGSGLYLQDDNEVGDVSVNTDASGGSFNLYSDDLAHVFKLNAENGHALTLNGGDFLAVNAAVGALVSVGAETDVGRFFGVNPGTLSTTSASFDASSDLAFEIADSGTTIGTDYGQMTSTGTVALSGAHLDVVQTLPSSQCPALPLGRIYTLISTTGSLSGQFGNAPNGATIVDPFFCGGSYRIDYHESGPVQTVTATVVSGDDSGTPPSNTGLPVVSGTPAVGATLSASPGSWSGDMPQTYAYQWMRDGQPIDGATSSTYVVSAVDQGHQLAVSVMATNSSGSLSISSDPLSIPAAGQPGTGGGGDPQPRPKPLIVSTASMGRIAASASGVVVQVRCSVGNGCPAITAQLVVVEHLHGSKITALSAAKRRVTTRTVVIGKATAKLAAGQSKQLTVRLNRTGRSLLKRFKHLSGKLKVTSGGKVVGTKGVSVKAERGRK